MVSISQRVYALRMFQELHVFLPVYVSLSVLDIFLSWVGLISTAAVGQQSSLCYAGSPAAAALLVLLVAALMLLLLMVLMYGTIANFS